MSQTIALVDDDRNILTGISMALEREGFKVQTYIDGESALIGLTRNPPDLAVLDIKMPRMDGEELLKKLKKKMSIPIIFLTSKDDEVDELLGLKLGADDFVKKSGGFSTKVLIERIRVQLRKKNNAQPTKIKTSGSTFKNPVNQTKKKVWELIKESVPLDTSFGDAYISKKHCNFFVNKNNASFNDMKKLIDFVSSSVEKKTGIKLEKEIKILE